MKSSFVSLVILFFVIGVCNGGNQLNLMYYRKTCPTALTIVRDITWKRVAANNVLPAKLLRLHFHDCFVRGCEASILLDSTPTNVAEKDAIPNLSLAGYDVIDEIKTKLEEVCTGVVSCADIVALAARDAVSYQFGRSMWQVLTGRRDGIVSHASEVLGTLPSPFSNFTTLLGQFIGKGLNLVDLVVLSGAHTIGVGHCTLFANRLYNFTGIGDADPSLNPIYARTLRTLCPNPQNPNTTVAMDPQSSFKFDSHYFGIVNQKMGLFQSDAALLTNPRSARLVRVLQNQPGFFAGFAQSMKKMGAIGVLTGGNGEIRKNCRVVNGA